MSKHNNKDTGRRVRLLSELPPGIFGRNPIIQIFSDKEIVFEGITEIEHYDESCVVVSGADMRISVDGKGLTIKCLTNNNLAVCGTISNINFVQM